MIKRIIGAVALGCCTGIFTGCATATPPVSFLYSPSLEARGGSGDLYLKALSGHPAGSGGTNVRWVIGKEKGPDGSVTSEILSASSAEDMVLDALKRELAAAGYRVKLDSSLPTGVHKGVDLASVQVELEETAGLSRLEATGRIKVSLDVWKNGARVKTLSFESRLSDIAIIDRERLAGEMVEKGLHAVMNQAVPDIVSVLEGRN